LLIVATVFATVAGAIADSDVSQRESARSLANEVLSEDEYQTTLPEMESIDADGSWFSWLLPLGSVASILLPALLVGVLLLLLFWLLRDFLVGTSRIEGRGDRHGDPGGTDGSARDPALDDPRRLAAQGQYERAVHVLLLLAIRRVCERSGVDPARSWTSRELARRLLMPDPARDGLRSLVRTVERSHFGGAAVAAEDYDRCLDFYRTATGEEPG
jgi:hypothetical protein